MINQHAAHVKAVTVAAEALFGSTARANITHHSVEAFQEFHWVASRVRTAVEAIQTSTSAEHAIAELAKSKHWLEGNRFHTMPHGLHHIDPAMAVKLEAEVQTLVAALTALLGETWCRKHLN